MKMKCIPLVFAALVHFVISKDDYDYVIVGAGSAGATLASRLSEDSDVNVLLLEVGPTPPSLTEIPLLFSDFLENTKLNWNYTTEPQEQACLGSIDNRCPYLCGRVVGGCSQHNYMLYVRGNKIDYDLWERADGAQGWGYDDVLRYFKKSEGVTIDNTIIDPRYHGRYGPLTISVADYVSKLRDVYLEAAKECGYNIVDYNGAIQKGFGITQLHTRNGYRCSTEMAYLMPAYFRRNLNVITDALVIKVNLVNKTAIGVTYLKDGKYYQVEAKREVILSAGAIRSPQILMLSGIGPKEHLKEMKIEVVQDLPVGQNLQDHVACNGLYFVLNDADLPTTNDVTNLRAEAKNRVYDHQVKLKGILSTSVVEVMGFIKSPYETIAGDFNDIQYFMVSSLVEQGGNEKKVHEFKANFNDKETFTIVPSLLHPKSRGNLTLRSRDARDQVNINMNYFTDKDGHDLNVMIYALEEATKLVASEAFSKFLPRWIGPFPGCERYSMSSKAYLECLVRSLTFSISHASGTCKMGHPSDPSTVVDPSLKVKGISKLRVVDASVMPRIISGNTNSPTIMIAEKAADIIKEERRSKSRMY